MGQGIQAKVFMTTKSIKTPLYSVADVLKSWSHIVLTVDTTDTGEF